MLKHGNLLVSAWEDRQLIGVARSVTDSHYACYLSDLAVDEAYQRRGIGRRLIEETRKQLGPRCKIRLIAAPGAGEFYERIGFQRSSRCWELE